MLEKVLQLKVPLIYTLSCGVVAWEGQPDYKLLLKSQVLEVPVDDSSKVVDAGPFSRQVEDYVGARHMHCHVDLLLQDGLGPLLDVWVGRVAVNHMGVDLANNCVLPPTVLD